MSSYQSIHGPSFDYRDQRSLDNYLRWMRKLRFRGWWDDWGEGPETTDDVASWVESQPETAHEYHAVINGNRDTFAGHLANGLTIYEMSKLEANPLPEDSDVELPEILLQSSIVNFGDKTNEGKLIIETTIPWLEIVRRIRKEQEFLIHFAKYPRKFEEFIAGAYRRAGWPIVELTPSSNDKGRDVIATKPGFGSIRIIDQLKAYSPRSLVSHNDVRAILGVLQTDPNTSKAVITTTSNFAPGILTSSQFDSFIPHRLELRNGEQLREWLLELYPDEW